MRGSRRGRKIVVDGKTFTYRVGERSTVIHDAEGKRFDLIDNNVLRGVSPDTFARGQWKRSGDGVVAPSRLAEFLKDPVLFRERYECGQRAQQHADEQAQRILQALGVTEY